MSKGIYLSFTLKTTSVVLKMYLIITPVAAAKFWTQFHPKSPKDQVHLSKLVSATAYITTEHNDNKLLLHFSIAASCYRKYQPIKDEVVWFTSTKELPLLRAESWSIMRMVVFVFVIPLKICFQQ